jgi:tol-pal system protein YbgF
MKTARLLPVLLAGSLACFGQSTKDQIKEVQRDIASVDDKANKLQRTMDEKFGAILEALRQSNDGVTRTNANFIALQNALNEKLNEQAKNAGGSAAIVGTKVDQMGEEFRAVRESVADMNSRMAKLEAKIVDLGNAVKTLSSPPPPPPGATPPTGAAPGPGGPPAGMSAETTYNNAYADFQKGNFDLAAQEFSDYLKYFSNTDYAPNAQFYLADIYYRKSDYAAAAKAFDAVLEFPDNSKTPDARYLKGMSLLKDGQRTAAAKEFRDLINQYPDNDLSTKAKAELRRLGLSTTTSATPARKKTSR